MRVFVPLLIAALSVAAGSWVGLHPPQDRRAPAPAAHVENEPEEPLHEAPPPVDYASMQGLSPWPRLNPEASIAKAWQLAEGPHRAPGDRRRLVTLTFDDGPFPETTPRVLELLDEYRVRATFFVIGRYLDGADDRARASREVLRAIAAKGHLIGNHTHDHKLLTAVTRTKMLEQIDRGSASIERVIGKRPLLFRPPFGQLDDFGEEAVRVRDLDIVLWNIEAKDMQRDDDSEMFDDLVRQIRYNEGGVVLLHDIRWSSVKILKKLLGYLDARRYDPERPDREGYDIVDLPAYLRAVEASPPRVGARGPKHKAVRAVTAKRDAPTRESTKRASPERASKRVRADVAAKRAPSASDPAERASARRAVSRR